MVSNAIARKDLASSQLSVTVARSPSTDISVGTECVCTVNGVAIGAFPSDCMESAVIAIPLPSTHTLTYITNKPLNETAEFLLANVRSLGMKAVF